MIGLEQMLETKASFSEKVIQFCKENDMTLMEGLTEYIQTRGIETEDVPSLLTNEFKAMIHKEASDLNMFRRNNGKVQFDD